MNEFEASKMRHPSAQGRSFEVFEQASDDVYRRFLRALEDLLIARALHGPSSVEVAQARAAVGLAREAATRSWREQAVAA